MREAGMIWSGRIERMTKGDVVMSTWKMEVSLYGCHIIGNRPTLILGKPIQT